MKHFIEIDDSTISGQELFGLIKSFMALSEINEGIKITEPIKAPAVLIERNEFLEDLLNELPIEMGILDKDGRYIYMNKKSVSKPERRAWIIGKTDEEYSREFNFRTDLHKNRTAAFNKACKSGKEVSWFEEFDMPDGSIKHYIRRYAPIYSKSGNFSCLIGYGLDITSIKDAEKKILETKNNVEKALKVKSDFLSTMSHEMRTPMNAIIGFSELMLDGKMDDESVKMLNSIRFSAGNLLGLITDILDLSTLEEGKVELQEAVFSLDVLIPQIKSTIELAAKSKNLELYIHIDEGIPNQLIGDEFRISQVLINLLTNAVKYTDEGSITVSVKSLGISESRCLLHIEIQDTGIGIPADKLKYIFDSFTQMHIQHTRKYGGTGLGLAIVKRLVLLMGGDINIDSGVGKGSSFNIALPLKVYVEKPTESKALATSSVNLLNDLKILAGKNILVIEDNVINQNVIGQMLKKLNLITTITENGKIGLDAMRSGTFDMILMDLHMPEMDGFEATELIRKFSAIPIIALTADIFPHSQERAYQCGVNDYITKPVRLDDLKSKLVKHII